MVPTRRPALALGRGFSRLGAARFAVAFIVLISRLSIFGQEDLPKRVAVLSTRPRLRGKCQGIQPLRLKDAWAQDHPWQRPDTILR